MSKIISKTDDTSSNGTKKSVMHWTVQVLDKRYHLNSEWYNFVTMTVKSPDYCEFGYYVRINETKGLDISIRKHSPKPGKAYLNVMFYTHDVNKEITLQHWIDDCEFPNILTAKQTEKTECERVICNMIWYGFKDEIPLLPSPSSLFQGIESFWCNPELSDFTLNIAAEKLPAHKIVLAAQSQVFARMFNSEMKETQSNSVDINDVEVNVMKEVLRYLYTNKAEGLDDLEMAIKVLIVADKYEVENLKHYCQHKLAKEINLENVLNILLISDTYNAEKLKSVVTKFMTKQKKQIVAKEEFKDMFLQRPDLFFDFVSMAI